jgi:putative peptidoglycan lipid II flippase
VPSAVCLAMFGRPIIDMIYSWGAFTEIHAANTALALRHYAYGLIGFAAVRVTVPFFYGCGDSKRPMRISIIAVAVNIALYLPLIGLLDFAGLAAATSIAGLVNGALLIYHLPSKGLTIAWGRLGLNLLRILVASVLAFYIAGLMPWRPGPFESRVVTRLVDLIVPLATAGVLYLLFCLVLKVNELSRLMALLKGSRSSGD